MKPIAQQFEDLKKIKIFEVSVTDKRTNEKDWIVFSIEIDGNNFKATHIGLTEEQEKSDKVAFTVSEIDEYFTLDENLQVLYDNCIQSIIDSDFYELTNED